MPVPLLVDNYAYLIIDRRTRKAAVIDPCDANGNGWISNPLNARETNTVEAAEFFSKTLNPIFFLSDGYEQLFLILASATIVP